MFQAQERHLVAAIQFTEEQEDEVDATGGFETFKASERQTSAGPSRTPQSTRRAVFCENFRRFSETSCYKQLCKLE